LGWHCSLVRLHHAAGMEATGHDDEKIFLLRLSRPTTPARRRGKSGRCRRSYCRQGLSLSQLPTITETAFTEFTKASGGPTARVDVISPHSVPRKDEARPAQIPAGLLIALSLSLKAAGSVRPIVRVHTRLTTNNSTVFGSSDLQWNNALCILYV
jgi:hypothetical protein